MDRLVTTANDGAARRREETLMRLVALIANGDVAIMSKQDEFSLRQLGYAACLVQGYLDDPRDNLGEAIRLAAGALEGKDRPDMEYRDAVQAKWGARWHLDAAKLRLEARCTCMSCDGVRGKLGDCRACPPGWPGPAPRRTFGEAGAAGRAFAGMARWRIRRALLYPAPDVRQCGHQVVSQDRNST
ncbi:MAG: hypothetical protein OXI87_00860 [Albidovulum sp.]|nr:hypothetical protein [Albidovulum sp.]